MAKPARGLPSNFALDLPDDRPVTIGDFLDEPPPVLTPPKRAAQPAPVSDPIRTETFYEPDPDSGLFARSRPTPVPERKPAAPKVIRYQLNLNPKSKKMFEELVGMSRPIAQSRMLARARSSRASSGFSMGHSMTLTLRPFPVEGSGAPSPRRISPAPLARLSSGRSSGQHEREQTFSYRRLPL